MRKTICTASIFVGIIGTVAAGILIAAAQRLTQ